MPSVCFCDATCCAPVWEFVNPRFSVFVAATGAALAAGVAAPLPAGLGTALGVAVVPPQAAAISPTRAAPRARRWLAFIRGPFRRVADLSDRYGRPLRRVQRRASIPEQYL